MFRFPTKTPFTRTSFPRGRTTRFTPTSYKEARNAKKSTTFKKALRFWIQNAKREYRNVLTFQNKCNIPHPKLAQLTYTPYICHKHFHAWFTKNHRAREILATGSKIVPVALEILFAARQQFTPLCVRAQEVNTLREKRYPLLRFTCLTRLPW